MYIEETLSTYQYHWTVGDDINVIHPSMLLFLPGHRPLDDLDNVFIAGTLAHCISEGDFVWVEKTDLGE